MTPDSPEKLPGTVRRLELEFDLYADRDMELTAAFGVAWRMTDPGGARNLEKHSGRDHHRLPVPSVFLLDRRKTIQFSYVNPDYRTRLSPDLLLAAARAFR